MKLELNEGSVEVGAGYVLRAGVILAALLFLTGTAMGGAAPSDVFPHRVQEVLSGAAAANPQAIMELGVLALIATPWMVVALSLAMFLHLRDRIYSAVCFFLLVMLVAGLFLGR